MTEDHLATTEQNKEEESVLQGEAERDYVRNKRSCCSYLYNLIVISPSLSPVPLLVPVSFMFILMPILCILLGLSWLFVAKNIGTQYSSESKLYQLDQFTIPLSNAVAGLHAFKFLSDDFLNLRGFNVNEVSAISQLNYDYLNSYICENSNLQI